MDTRPLTPPLLLSVLIVDDEPDICMGLGDFLKHDGYAVRTVHAGRDALHEVEGGQIGVVILDLGLPDLSGLEVLRGIKKLDPLLPVIVLTASTQENHAVEALHCGAFTYLTKPYNSYELRFALRQIVDERKLASKVARVEGDLRASEERLRTVVGTTPDAVVLADRNESILFWNQAAARLFGYTEKEVNAGIGGARTTGHETHAGSAGELALGLGHEGSAALLPAGDEADAVGIFMKAVQHRQVTLTRHTEACGDALRDQRFDQGVAGGPGCCGGRGFAGSSHVRTVAARFKGCPRRPACCPLAPHPWAR